MATRKAHIGKMESQLKHWGAKLDGLLAKADDTSAETKAEYRKSVGELKQKHQAAQAKLDELKAAGSEKWEVFKVGVDSAWRELEVAFKKLTE